MSRANFTETTKTILARRAAYRCSYAGCGKLTVGPGKDVEQIELTGKAAHVYSAASGGPRGQGGLSPQQLKSAANGLWLCSHHADLVDKNRGTSYPASLLLSWKALHEARVAQEHSGRAAVFGFARRLTVTASPLFQPGATMDLGQLTFLVGENGSGKTALCQWLSSIDNFEGLARWYGGSAVEFAVNFDAPVEHELKVQVGGSAIAAHLDGTKVASNHHRLAVTFLKREPRPDEDDLRLFCRLFGTDSISMQALASFVEANKMQIEAAEFRREVDDEGEDKTNLYCRQIGGEELPFGNLSGGEQSRLILEFAIAKMKDVAKFGPALLVFERAGLRMDEVFIAPYLDYLSSPTCPFQTLITQLAVSRDMERLGHAIYEIQSPGGGQPRALIPR